MIKILKKHYLFLIILFVASFLRFYNFADRVVYGPEQAMSLTVSGNYLTDKFSFLGQPYFRETQDSHTLFSGAIFNYSLIPLQLFFNYDPIKITYFFALLNLLTGVLIYKYSFLYLNEKVAIYSAFIFLFNSFMIYHSFFIWNYNYLPLVFLINLIFLYKYWKNERLGFIFLVGLMCGLGVSLQYLYLLPSLVLLLIMLYKSQKKTKALLIFGLGAVIGNLPMLLFDLRHNFYHLVTFFDFAVNQLASGAGSGFRYYHFLYIWILLALVGGYLLDKYVKSTVLVVVILVLYALWNMSSNLVSFEKAVGMPENLTASEILKASEFISKENAKSFNVSETYDFDSRASVLRYPLEFIYNNTPEDQLSYQSLDALYVLSDLGYDYKNPSPWEIKTYMPYSAELVYEINSDWGVYKLSK